jgi:hypothetical protein
VPVDCIDVPSDVETPQEVAETTLTALDFVPPDRFHSGVNPGTAPMAEIAYAKLASLAAGTELACKAIR